MENEEKTGAGTENAGTAALKEKEGKRRKHFPRIFGKIRKKPVGTGFLGILVLVLLIVNLVLVALFGLETLATGRRMSRLLDQLSYLSDTNTVLISEIDNMKSDIEASMEETSSLVESYDVTLDSIDFRTNTYIVDINVVPKSYTDDTKLSIYFGTQGFALEKEEMNYSGQASLDWEDSYAGNVTVLIEEGKLRSTQLLSSYTDVQKDLSQVLSASLNDAPTYSDGILKLNGSGYVQLDANDYFHFESLNLIILSDGQVCDTVDLAAMAHKESAMDLDGFAYSFTVNEEVDTAPEREIRIQVEAKTEEGYTFTSQVYCSEIRMPEGYEENQAAAQEGISSDQVSRPVSGDDSQNSILDSILGNDEKQYGTIDADTESFLEMKSVSNGTGKRVLTLGT